MKKVLIRADDLGYSRGVNYGIYDSVHKGIIKNVGVMINMPFTKHGLSLLKNEDIDLGLHINISNDVPVLNPKLIPSLTDKNGVFKRSKVYRLAFKNGEDFVDLNEAVQEIDAQYKLFRKLIGRDPDYFEGHAVMSNNFIKALSIVADKYNLPLVKFGLPDTPFSFKQYTKFVAVMDSMFPNYDPMNSLKRMISKTKNNNDVIPMFVAHPGYLDQYILNNSSLTIPRTQEVEMLINPNTKKYLFENQIKLIRYIECK